MQTSASLPTPLLTDHRQTVTPKPTPLTKVPIAAGDLVTKAVGPLSGAVAYANILAKTGEWPTIGVVQSTEGWNLISLNYADGGTPWARDSRMAGSGSAKLQRHSYQLAAVVGPQSVTTWQGKQRMGTYGLIRSQA